MFEVLNEIKMMLWFLMVSDELTREESISIHFMVIGVRNVGNEFLGFAMISHIG